MQKILFARKLALFFTSCLEVCNVCLHAVRKLGQMLTLQAV